jgi:UDP-N-acetyl-D-mannosaminuronic acid transferase (WecB/TagA/CpsF family)
MALFKCKQTNNTVEFENEWDIVQMRAHPEYEEILEEVKSIVEKPAKKTAVKSEEV